MKKLTKTLIAASLICLLAGPTTAFGQFRSGKSGSSKTSMRGFSGGKNTNLSRNGGSSSSKFGSRPATGRPTVSRPALGRTGSSSKFNFGKVPSSKGTSTFSPSKPQFGRGFGGITQGKPITKPTTKFPISTKPAFGNGQSIGKPIRFPGVQSKPTIKNPIGNWTKPSGSGPTVKLPGTSGSWLPRNHGISGKTPLVGSPNGGPRIPKPSFNNGHNSGSTAGSRPTTSVKLNHGWQHAVKNILHHNKQHWCHSRPAKCQWWVSYCEPISHCHAHEIVVCDWNRVQCVPVVHGGVQVQAVQWYLGMKGMLLPGKGIGIEAIEAGSPAEQVGLRPGMVMTVANGIALVDEASMQEAIRISGGVLQMTLLSDDGSQVLEGVVQMVQVAAVSF